MAPKLKARTNQKAIHPTGQRPNLNSTTPTRGQAAQTQQSSVPPHPEQIPEASSTDTTGPFAGQQPTQAISAPPSRARTPIEVKASTKGSQRKKANYHDLVIREMGRRVHFLPVKEFFDKFVPGGSMTTEDGSRSMAQAEETVAEKILKTKSEQEMYPILCAAFAQILQGTGHIVVDTADDGEDGDKDLKPDLTMYNRTVGEQAWDIKPSTSSTAAAARQEYRGRIAWFFSEMFIEVKHTKSRDPFDGRRLRRSQLGNDTFEQIARAAAESLNLQHRVFLFTALVVKTKARLLRWDRAGVVVSDEFDIGAEPGWLSNFVYRVATSEREAQGFDTTVSDANEEQIRQLDTYIEKETNVYAKEYLEEMNTNRTLYPIQQLQCDIFEFARAKIDGDPQYKILQQKKQVTLLIGHICFAHSSLSGRGTKGFVAFVVDGDRLVFLKESWRPTDTYRLVRKEGDIYCDLITAGVPFIPFAFAGGDVSESHVTLNDEFLTATERQQYRLVLWEVGIPLDRHDDSYALVSVMRHALKAHWTAWEKAGILHRDISPSNILIDIIPSEEGPEGLLCDWELSKKKTELMEGAAQHVRSGTWITLSAASLKYPYKPIELSDDLESFYHVLAYNALRFYRHSMTISPSRHMDMLPGVYSRESTLSQFVWSYFHQHSSDEDGYPDTGGERKWLEFKSPTPSFHLLDKECALNKLLERVHEICFEHYLTVDVRDLAKYLPSPAKTFSVPAAIVQNSPEWHQPRMDERDMALFAVPQSRKRKRLVVESSYVPGTSSTALVASAEPPDSPLINHIEMYRAFLEILMRKEDGTSGWRYHDKTHDQFEQLGTYIGVPDKKSLTTRTKSAVQSPAPGSRQGSRRGSARNSPLPRRSPDVDDSEEQPTPKRPKLARGSKSSAAPSLVHD